MKISIWSCWRRDVASNDTKKTSPTHSHRDPDLERTAGKWCFSKIPFMSVLRKSTSERSSKAPTRRSHAASSSICTDGNSLQMKSPQSTTTSGLMLTRQCSGAASPNTFTRRKSFITSDNLVKTLKRDSGIRRRFESFAAHQYAGEGVTFIKNVLEWKALTPGNREQAEKMYETYIKEGSPLQINISWDARVNVENQLATLEPRDEVPLTIFDESSNEVARMMVEGGVWGSFVWRGGCDNPESQEDMPDAEDGRIVEKTEEKMEDNDHAMRLDQLSLT